MRASSIKNAAALDREERKMLQEIQDAQRATATEDIPIFAPEEPPEAATAGPVDLGPIARTYVNTTNPDTGTPVVFVPGDALPDWARHPTT